MGNQDGFPDVGLEVRFEIRLAERCAELAQDCVGGRDVELQVGHQVVIEVLPCGAFAVPARAQANSLDVVESAVVDGDIRNDALSVGDMGTRQREGLGLYTEVVDRLARAPGWSSSSVSLGPI
jgi:hypothetical protein